MGGVKKKSLASMEKSQDSQDGAQEQAAPAKGKKAKEQKSGPPQQKKLAFLMPKMSDADLVKSLTPLKAVTISTTSRVLGVNSSIATMVLKDLEGKSLLKKAGGFSGHAVWSVA
ncbi:MAG: hypothetical protein HY247_01610 [archaeon]|nr:MAG: hypothetical protein HY247_01610 [archaeon]